MVCTTRRQEGEYEEQLPLYLGEVLISCVAVSYPLIVSSSHPVSWFACVGCSSHPSRQCSLGGAALLDRRKHRRAPGGGGSHHCNARIQAGRICEAGGGKRSGKQKKGPA